jgi:hypothetical protein
MTDLTPSVQELLREKRKEIATDTDIPQTPPRDPKNVNEFLKEAYRIVSPFNPREIKDHELILVK